MKNSKKAFSLVGVIMVLLIIFMTMMFSASLISKKHQKTTSDSDNGVSGKYVCYEDPNNQGSFINQYYTNGNLVKNESKGRCIFAPPQNAQHLNIQITGGGSGGGGTRQIDDQSIHTFNYQTGYLPLLNLNTRVLNAFGATSPNPSDIDNVLITFLRTDEGIFVKNSSNKYSNARLDDVKGNTQTNDFRFGMPKNTIPMEIRCIYKNDENYLVYKNSHYHFNGILAGITSLTSRDVVRNLIDNTILFIHNRNGNYKGGTTTSTNYAPAITCGSGGLGLTCDKSKANPVTNTNKLFSPIQYLNFLITGEKKTIYSGQGGNPGETVSHLTSNIKLSDNNEIQITLGRGGEGGNCYSSGNYFSNDCAGQMGEDTVVTINGATIKASGGKAIQNPRPHALDYVLPLQGAIEVLKQSPDKISNGKESELHNSSNIEYQTGNGGDGAKIKDKCKLGRVQYQVNYCGYRGDGPANIPTGNTCNTTYSDSFNLFDDGQWYNPNALPENASMDDACKDDDALNDFEYIGTNRHIGQRGQGGAIVITW